MNLARLYMFSKIFWCLHKFDLITLCLSLDLSPYIIPGATLVNCTHLDSLLSACTLF